MSATRCLIVGYDGSPSSRLAAAWAAHDVGHGGRLVLVHAERPLHAPAVAGAAARDELGAAVLDEVLLDAGEALLDTELATELYRGDPVGALADAAARHEATAIVVGAKRHSRLHRALGVVTGELLERSPVPVIVVPAGVSLPPAAGDPARRTRSPRARNGSRPRPPARSARRA